MLGRSLVPLLRCCIRAPAGLREGVHGRPSCPLCGLYILATDLLLYAHSLADFSQETDIKAMLETPTATVGDGEDTATLWSTSRALSNGLTEERWVKDALAAIDDTQDRLQPYCDGLYTTQIETLISGLERTVIAIVQTKTIRDFGTKARRRAGRGASAKKSTWAPWAKVNTQLAKASLGEPTESAIRSLLSAIEGVAENLPKSRDLATASAMPTMTDDELVRKCMAFHWLCPSTSTEPGTTQTGDESPAMVEWRGSA
ncbi:hypothetical protein Q5752_001452 [Cryptotrichosporon argae]